MAYFFFLLFAITMYLRYRNMAQTLLVQTPNRKKFYPQKYVQIKAPLLFFFGLTTPKMIPRFIYLLYYFAIASLVSAPINTIAWLLLDEKPCAYRIIIVVNVGIHVGVSIISLVWSFVFKKYKT